MISIGHIKKHGTQNKIPLQIRALFLTLKTATEVPSCEIYTFKCV
jgi:hypothetical protein